MEKRIHSACDNIRIALQIMDRIESGARFPAFLPAEIHVVGDRIEFHAPHVRILSKIPVDVEPRRLPDRLQHMVSSPHSLPALPTHLQRGRYGRARTWTVAFSGEPGSGKRSEEHTSELQSLMRISYAVFCLKK